MANIDDPERLRLEQERLERAILTGSKKSVLQKTDSTMGREEKEKERRERERQENEQREREAREKLAREKLVVKATSTPVKSSTVADTILSVSVTDENLKKEEDRLLNAISMKKSTSFSKPASKPVTKQTSIQKEPEKKIVTEKKTRN